MTIDPQWLRRRYVDDRSAVVTIAAEAGVNVATIHRAVRAAGVAPRGKADAATVTLDHGWLAERVAAGASPYAIARHLGVSRSSVEWALAGVGLLALGDEERALAALARVEYERGRSLREVSAVVGRDRRTVTLWLRALGVPIRGRGRKSRIGAEE